MPSATVPSPSACASATIVWMSTVDSGESAMPLMNERSILSASTGNCRR